MDENHPASFRRSLRENLTRLVPLGECFEIDGSYSDPDRVRKAYVQKLQVADPQMCLLGIGENRHLAFNDPAEAIFNDPGAMNSSGSANAVTPSRLRAQNEHQAG